MSKRSGNTEREYVAKVKVITPGSSGDKCPELSFTGSLQDVQQPALSKLVKGYSYEIELNNNVPKVHNTEGEICGTIVSLRITELIECLQSGKLFSAKVLEIKGDLCTVAVKAS